MAVLKCDFVFHDSPVISISVTLFFFFFPDRAIADLHLFSLLCRYTLYRTNDPANSASDPGPDPAYR